MTAAQPSESLHPLEPLLIVDDDEAILRSMQAVLRAFGFSNAVFCADSREVHAILAQRRFSAVMLDLNMPHISGIDLLPEILLKYPEMPVVVVTGTDDVEMAVECMKAGAFDYVVKPADSTRLLTSLKNATERWEIRNENRRLRDSLFSSSLTCPEAFASIVTRSPAMHTIFRYIEAIAATSLPILITGETGTGKELVAESIHAASGRSGRFVAVNAAGLDDALFSDTLFGHMKGSFTDAAVSREGMIGKAAHGTLFLDEVGDLSVESQIRILRLLQEKEYYPLGSDVPHTTDARFIFATNHDLESFAAKGIFRQDLYYRLQSHHIHLPPLRDRPEDVAVLADHFLGKAAKETGRKMPRVPRELYQLLQTYGFPGNIRELEGLITDAVVRNDSGILPLHQLKETMKIRMDSATGMSSRGPGEAELNPFSSLQILPPLKQIDQLLILEAMRRSGGNQTIAAHLLGMSRTTLNKRLKKAPA
jgi:DNA-binding NtrC family response regulator